MQFNRDTPNANNIRRWHNQLGTTGCLCKGAVAELLQRWDWEVLKHPLYSSDMSPCDYDWFPQLKEPLRGKRFPDIASMLHAVGEFIRKINRNNLANGIQRLPRIWQKIQEHASDYIERICKGWEDHLHDHTSPPFWLDDRSTLLRHVDVKPAVGWSILTLRGL
ncbi:hypothetical protein ANN_00636 [Periplaneta americana]|uniref:Mariner Mos1 transposase n=1 Tax=Periplaneta americana TaxID=6978 RepID=A0ABQ8TUJ7_PERAM|nr:hypothetical protein ANN_00636 [Periplaneta americana]